jgi:hypothetical protein
MFHCESVASGDDHVELTVGGDPWGQIWFSRHRVMPLALFVLFLYFRKSSGHG